MVSQVTPGPTEMLDMSLLTSKDLRARRSIVMPPGALLEAANQVWPPERMATLPSWADRPSALMVTATSSTDLGLTKHAGWTAIAWGVKYDSSCASYPGVPG